MGNAFLLIAAWLWLFNGWVAFYKNQLVLSIIYFLIAGGHFIYLLLTRKEE